MTQVFEDSGEAVPVTVIEAGPCPVIQKKTKDIDGYEALQLGFEKKKKNVKKPIIGHFKKAGVEPRKVVMEFRIDSAGEYQAGQEITADMFSPGDFVDVAGVSKGKGFTGVVKRWGFAGGPGSHGSHKWNRRPGSIGASATPSRVLKGMKMAGHAGARRVSIQSLKVVRVDKEKNLLLVKGAVAGASGGYLVIKKAKKRQNKAVDSLVVENKKTKDHKP
jgi:large subunit ribosomal protein L3